MMAPVNSDLDPGMHCVEGVWLPAMLTEDYIKQMKGFKINKDDIIVTGYPRTGNYFIFTQKALLLRHMFKEVILFINKYVLLFFEYGFETW